ncbi:hypothetical protein [Dysgonomonas sp. GY617]|uniref:hypothetical protein n=1 Tax=Dysgonomonas sp. GY617 TaxID=2780420 RepID=UPI001883CB23|nr:hypothetical protein [Dysgonomonas sp. GY617]MBF0576614.1 hypothetical protein [Dysgonomonas sp. GY617]
MSHVPSLKEVDEDWGQMEFYEGMPPVKMPCALIDIQDGQFTDAGDLRQQGTLTVVVKLYILRLSNTSNKAPQNQKDNAKKGWVAYEDIVKALHGQDFIKNGFAAPIRTRMQRIKRRDGIYERDITFSIGFTDTSCVPQKPKVKPTISLAASVE